MEEENAPKKKRMPGQINHKYAKPEVVNRVVELYSAGSTWKEVAATVGKEIDEPTFSDRTAKGIYNKAVAKKITTEKRSGKKFDDFGDQLNEMYGKAIKVLGRWINAAEKLSEKLEESIDNGNIDAIKAYGFYLKSAPQMKSIAGEIRDYVRLHQDQQEKIKVEQQALVWDESQMLDYMDKYLKSLEKEGKIRFIKPKLL